MMVSSFSQSLGNLFPHVTSALLGLTMGCLLSWVSILWALSHAPHDSRVRLPVSRTQSCPCSRNAHQYGGGSLFSLVLPFRHKIYSRMGLLGSKYQSHKGEVQSIYVGYQSLLENKIYYGRDYPRSPWILYGYPPLPQVHAQASHHSGYMNGVDRAPTWYFPHNRENFNKPDKSHPRNRIWFKPPKMMFDGLDVC